MDSSKVLSTNIHGYTNKDSNNEIKKKIWDQKDNA